MSEQVAVITGAARGLGKSFTGELLNRGYKVYFCDIDENEGEKSRTEFAVKYGKENVQFKKCDVRKEEDWKAFFEEVLKKYNRVDLMVNNAGIVHEKEWRRCVDVNLNGMIQGSMLAIDHMRHRESGKGGIIINVSSLAGVLPVMFSPVYSATKSGIIAFTRSWAMNPYVNTNGIRMVCLCPAFADTDIVKNTTEDQFQGKEYSEALLKRFDIMPVERVTEAFKHLLDDKDNNGQAMIVTATNMNYVDFPNPLTQTTS